MEDEGCLIAFGSSGRVLSWHTELMLSTSGPRFSSLGLIVYLSVGGLVITKFVVSLV